MSKLDEHKKQQAEEIKDNLTKVFQQYTNTDVPEDLEDEIFSTLDTIELVAGFMDLFTIKFAQTEAELIDGISENESQTED